MEFLLVLNQGEAFGCSSCDGANSPAVLAGWAELDGSMKSWMLLQHLHGTFSSVHLELLENLKVTL